MFAILRKATIGSVCPHGTTGRILTNFYIWGFFLENLSITFGVSLKSDKITGTLHKDVFTFMTISRWILLTMTNVLNKECREIKIHVSCLVTFFRKLLTFMWLSKNVFEPESSQMTIWRSVSCWISKATHVQKHAHAHAPTPTHPTTRARARKHAHTHTEIFNTYCCSQTTMVSWMRLNAMSYVHCFLFLFT